MYLLVVLGIHEAIAVAVLVEILHRNLVHGDFFDRIGGTKTMLEHGAGADVAQLGLDERAQVARRAMLYCKDQMKVVVVLDDHPRTHLGCWNCHELNSSP